MAVTAGFLLDSVGGVTKTGYISNEFIAIILIPSIGNAAGMIHHLQLAIFSLTLYLIDNLITVTTAVKDKLNLSCGTVIGSTIVSPLCSRLR